MKPAAWVGMGIILAALAFGARAFVTNLTPYVTFGEARQARGAVQVIAKLDKNSIGHGQGNTLNFVLVDDKNDRLPVQFSGPRAPNFDQAIQVTAIGKYDGQVFQADNLLVKCPTKYQGTDVQTYRGAQTNDPQDARQRALSGAQAALKEKTR